MNHPTRAGTVALIGLPNAGKSSLLNRLLDTKLSIVTPRAQTTRERVVGIDTQNGVQMVFLDTPGVVRAAYLLHHSMLEIVQATIADADVVVLVLDPTRNPEELGADVTESLTRARARVLVIVNKTDSAAETQIDAAQDWAESRFGARGLRVSAETGVGLEELRVAIGERLPESPFLYPEDELSSQSTRFFVSELIRESVFERFGEEIPYSAAVRVEEFREEKDPLVIRATIYVERASQKGILIGSRGAAIRELGTAARLKIEAFLGRRVFLELWVKVLPKWRKNPLELKRFGFPVPKEME